MQIGGNVFNAGGGASQGRRKENLMRMNLFIVNIALVILLCGMFFSETGFAAVTGKPAVVKWYKDKKAAVSLRFDDNHVSHLKTVVPLLKRYGFRATFMVSPGKDSYRQYKSMWGKEIPFMGHRLGNHTLNHSGAVDLKEADYEIGEATRMIRKAHPTESQLMVFASGGGKKWGGTYWEKADQAYYDIARKYKLIDLYDGNHPSLRIDAGSKTNKLCSLLDEIIKTSSYQPFHFHHIGNPTPKGWFKIVLGRQNLATKGKTFAAFLECLSERGAALWIAPVVDVLKYEQERNSTDIQILNSDKDNTAFVLKVGTDPELYDHKLTLKIPARENMTIVSIFQGKDERKIYQSGMGKYYVDLDPVNSVITINYHKV